MEKLEIITVQNMLDAYRYANTHYKESVTPLDVLTVQALEELLYYKELYDGSKK